MKELTIDGIRKEMSRNGVFWWQVAREINVSEATIYRWIRAPVKSGTLVRLNTAVKEIIKNRTKGAE